MKRWQAGGLELNSNRLDSIRDDGGSSDSERDASASNRDDDSDGAFL